MGRKKFSQREIDIIGKLLRRKNAGTRFQQKMIRHTLRVDFEFNISDFNVQGKAFGYDELQECIQRGRIQILDDATIEAMKARHAEKRERDAMLAEAEAIANGEAVDWKKVQEEWDAYYGQQTPFGDGQNGDYGQQTSFGDGQNGDNGHLLATAKTETTDYGQQTTDNRLRTPFGDGQNGDNGQLKIYCYGKEEDWKQGFEEEGPGTGGHPIL